MDAAKSESPVELFVTCVVDHFFPDVGESVFHVLRALGVDVQFNQAQTCCGQPAFNTGYWDEARPIARRLLSQYDGSVPVVVPSGSCTAMIRNYYHELFAGDPVNQRRAERLSQNVFEFSEYLDANFSSDDLSHLFNGDSDETTVVFHEACHGKRELGIDSGPKSLLSLLPGVTRVELEQAEVCCGFGGTFSVKYPAISGAMLREKLDYIEASGADIVTACDSSCLMHIGGGLSKRGSQVRTVHLAELVASRLGGE